MQVESKLTRASFLRRIPMARMTIKVMKMKENYPTRSEFDEFPLEDVF